MKTLIYQIEGYLDVHNPETEKVEKQPTLATVTVENPSEKDIAQAAEIAYNGEYTIEDDGEPVEPTAEEMLNALLGVTE